MNKIYPITAVFIFIIIAFIWNWPEQNRIETNKGTLLCDFEYSPCAFNSSQGKAWLQAEPAIIKTENEITFSLSFDDPSNVVIKTARLEGKDMYMGVIPVFFTKVGEQYRGGAMLGACMHDKMVWQMFVEIEVDGKPQTLVYDFYSEQD